MRQVEMEHANINVVDADRTVAFLLTAFPHWRVRGGGKTSGEGWEGSWLHIGTELQYVAVQATTVMEVHRREGLQITGFNHVGFWVDDVDAILARMQAAGYEGVWGENSHRRRRLYVTDHDGLTWEFIEYLSDKDEERNDYSF